MIVIGVDPGGTTGIAVITLGDDGKYYTLHSVEVPGQQFVEAFGQVIDGLVASRKLMDGEQMLIATEQFVVRGRASRSKTPQGGQLARRIIGWLESIADRGPAYNQLRLRSASQVKKWATNRRLERAGLLASIPASGGHARDAGRHALFAARMDLKWPDPLSATYPK